MNRRQELLRAAGNFADVAEYDRACARGTGLAPLPVLFIVVDEFSELLSQHPDFIDLFIALGRLGRSLGLVVDHREGRVVRRQQVIADWVTYRQAGHQGCACEPWPRSSRIDCITP